jgi:hypothetical protein
MCQISQQTTVKFTQDRACPAIRKPNMTILARLGVGRIVLHFIAMPGNRCVRFHFEGIAREVPVDSPGTGDTHPRGEPPFAALTLYLARPFHHSITDPSADQQSLAAVLKRGDVLLTHGNSRIAALLKSITSSSWSHVSMYVGPLDDVPDPRCVVVADADNRRPHFRPHLAREIFT